MVLQKCVSRKFLGGSKDVFSVSTMFHYCFKEFKSGSTMFQDCLDNCHWCFTSVLWMIQGSSKEVVRVVQDFFKGVKKEVPKEFQVSFNFVSRNIKGASKVFQSFKNVLKV